MPLFSEIKKVVTSDLKLFQSFQVFLAFVCILIPLIFLCAEPGNSYVESINLSALHQTDNCNTIEYKMAGYGKQVHDSVFFKDCPSTKGDSIFVLSVNKIQLDAFGFRPSLSHYALGNKTYLFGLVYCMAAMMFIYSGVVNIKNEELYARFNSQEPWYNIAIGICLLMVVLFPVNGTSEFAHYAFSILFFAGNILVIIFFPTRTERRLKLFGRIVIAAVSIITLVILGYKEILSVLWIEWISLTFISVHLILKGIIRQGDVTKPTEF